MDIRTETIENLMGQEILFVSIPARWPLQFPNETFRYTRCTIKYNIADEDVRHFEYVLECSVENGFLNDGSHIVKYYTKEDYPEYWL